MAAQLENGYTRIANEILDHIAKTKLNGSQFRIVMAVFRYTYGFNRKEHEMSIGFIAKATGMNKRQVQRELSTLIDARIIKVVKESTHSSPAVLSFNKYFDQWCLNSQQVSKQSTGDELAVCTDDRLDVTPDDGLDTRGDVGLVTQEIQLKDNIKDNSKENIYSQSHLKVFSVWNKQEIIRHKKITSELKKAIDKAVKEYGVENVILAIERYGRIYKDPNYFFSYKWDLVRFLRQRNALPDFLDEGSKWEDYKARGHPDMSAREEEATFDWGWTKET